MEQIDNQSLNFVWSTSPALWNWAAFVQLDLKAQLQGTDKLKYIR